MSKDNIWSKDGTAYQKGAFIYSHQEAARRGFESQEEADRHDKEDSELQHPENRGEGKMKTERKMTEDELKEAEKETQKLTDEHIQKIDDLIKHKEKEILEVQLQSV